MLARVKRTLLFAAPALLLACGSTVEAPAGGAPGHTTSHSTTSTSSTSETVTTSSSSSSSTTTTTSATGCLTPCSKDEDCAGCSADDGNVSCCDQVTSICYSTSAPVCPLVCVSHCLTDAECDASCPPLQPGASNCCDPAVGICFVAYDMTCAAALQPCEPGGACSAAPAQCSPHDSLCVCDCDSTGHYACGVSTPLDVCPPEPPTCGAPCDVAVTCSCDPGGGQAPVPCGCTVGAWQCGIAESPCPPQGTMTGSCGTVPVGTLCSGLLEGCRCSDACGAPLWFCSSNWSEP